MRVSSRTPSTLLQRNSGMLSPFVTRRRLEDTQEELRQLRQALQRREQAAAEDEGYIASLRAENELLKTWIMELKVKLAHACGRDPKTGRFTKEGSL